MGNFDYLEEGTRKFIEGVIASGGKPIYQLSPVEARNVLENVQKSVKLDNIPVNIEDHEIPGKTPVSIRIVRPENNHDRLPVIMYFHGGGWILGSKNTHDRILRELAAGTNAAIVFVNYTPSPEAQFPIALEEAYTATKYIAEHGNDFNLDGSRLTVFGDSVGGNMAIGVTLLAKERKGPKIQFQVLFYPVTDANFNTGSYKQFAEGPWLTKAAMEWFWNAYAPNEKIRNQITVSPLRATPDQLKGLPPALIVTDENDVLRDEGEAYAHKLIQAGVPVTSVRFLGTLHDFILLNPIANSSATRSAMALAIDTLNKVLWGNLVSASKF